MFDFDGVIVNSCQLGFEINREVIKDIQYSEIQDWGEGNIYNRKLREGIDDSYEFYYFEQYSQRVTDLIPVEGMETVFKELDLKENKLIIVSSSDEDSIKTFLEKHNLDKYFTEIMGRKTNPSKVEKFKMVFDKYKIEPDETLIITDSVGDVKEAHEAKMKAIGVVWGLHEKERLEKNGSDFVADTPNDILKGIENLLALN